MLEKPEGPCSRIYSQLAAEYTDHQHHGHVVSCAKWPVTKVLFCHAVKKERKKDDDKGAFTDMTWILITFFALPEQLQCSLLSFSLVEDVLIGLGAAVGSGLLEKKNAG